MSHPPVIQSPGLATKIKDRLIQQALERRAQSIDADELRRNSPPPIPRIPRESRTTANIPDAWSRFDEHPGYQRYRLIRDGARKVGIANPFFQVQDGVSGATALVEGKDCLNFSGYNYLGLCGHPEVDQAAIDAIRRCGTSVSASRIVSGERQIHRDLEKQLATLYGADDCLAMVSGHATTVTTLGYLFGPRDLIVHDAFIHNCAVEGARLSGAKRLSFPHNDWQALNDILERSRNEHERVCVIIEGLYSMDGDFPDLPHFIEVKKRHRTFLMVDEAHSLGVMGQNGLGISEHFGTDPADVDIWMGTLSKALAGCGGYVAGEQALIDNLRHAAPGFVYSVGMSPPVAAASLAALEIMLREPKRVKRLHEVGAYFLSKARQAGIDTGLSTGFSIIPAITGSSLRAARLSHAMRNHGINVQPILYPAVSEKAARLRFFMCSEHTEEQIDRTLQSLALEWGRI
jgi:8-amino-7-oxononanoate synthase